jgi:hypothetical protein
VDRSGWAVAEARLAYRSLGLGGSARVGDLVQAPLDAGSVLAAFAVNELEAPARARLLEGLLAAARRGASVLVVEPIARRPISWWGGWEAAVVAAGGRSDEWRLAVELPDLVRRLDEAAGLCHRELTGRSLFLP